MTICSQIPANTPVATFDHSSQMYTNTGTSQSGIFIECAPEGFRVGLIFHFTLFVFNVQSDAKRYKLQNIYYIPFGFTM